MPRIIIARDDIPEGLFQILDLKPHSSKRVPAYQLVGQTGYLRGIPNETVTTVSAGIVQTQIKGLTAWFLGKVSSGAGAKATANITTVTKGNLANGDHFTISDGVNNVTFEVIKTAPHGIGVGRVALDVTAAVSANDVRDTIVNAINALESINITAASGGAATVTMTNNHQNQSTLDQDAVNSESVANAGFTIANFAGAADSDPLTVAEAIQNATDIISQVETGSALDHDTINGALTTGSVTWEQVSEILDILSGYEFILPADVDIGTTEFVPSGNFSDDTLQNPLTFYNTGEFKASWRSGMLSVMRSTTFTYMGDQGAAVSVYNDDGSVYSG